MSHRDLALRYGHDPRTAAANYRAWNLWHLGFPQQARNATEQALEWAREVDHLNTLGIAMCYGVTQTNIWLRDLDRVEAAAREALRFAAEMSLALWQAWARIYLGWALAERGTPEALAELEAGLEESIRIGARRLEAFHLGLTADVRSRAGQHDAAKAAFADAFTALESSRDLPFTADLHRLRALALLRASARSTEEATADLQRALKIARQQDARSLELRAARDLARLWRTRASDRRRTTFSHRCMTGSPRASIPPISRMPRPCLTNWHEREVNRPVTANPLSWNHYSFRGQISVTQTILQTHARLQISNSLICKAI
jgi:tetratricopeptide (TPR) repeat protein